MWLSFWQVSPQVSTSTPQAVGCETQGMAPHDMWDANPIYTHEFHGAYIEMLERELGWRVGDWHVYDEEEIDVNDEEDPNVAVAMEEGFECEEVLDSDDEGTEIESLILYQDIVAVINDLPPIGSAQNPIDLTYL